MKNFLADLGERIRNTLAPAYSKLRARLAPMIAEEQARLEPYIRQLRARYQALQPRERVLVQVAGGLIALLFLYNFVYSPIVDLGSGLDQRIAERQRDLGQVQRLARSYTQLKHALAAAQHNTVPSSKDFSLFSVVESMLTKSVGRDKIASITPGTDEKLPGGLTKFSVQLKLNKVTLGQVVDALYGVRTLSVPVAVSNLRIERETQDTHSFDVDMTCVALGSGA